jgi:hypothetical protein
LALLAAACAENPKHAEMVTPSGSNVPSPPNIDRTKCDEKGKNVVTADTNLDQKPDVWKFYQAVDMGGQKTEVLTCKEVDLNHDGKIDLVYYYDEKGIVSMDEADTDFDGKFDMTVYYGGGKKVREEFDTNFDGKPDVWKYFEDEKLVRQERDTNGDGTVNKWDRAPEGDDTEPGGGAAPAAAGNGATAPAAPAAPAPTAPPPATSPPPAKGAAPAAKPAPAPAKK